MTFSAARADNAFARVDFGSYSGYIVPDGYATENKADLMASIPGPVLIDSFWTPSEQDFTVADRAFLEMIHAAAKDPTLLFPDLAPRRDPAAVADPAKARDLEHEQAELALVAENYENYSRQYVGIIIGGKKLVFCNYSDGTKVDPSVDYIFIQKVFVADGTMHFLQCRFEPVSKICSNVSMIGSWQPTAK